MDREELLDNIKSAFVETEDLRSIVSDINSYDGWFEELQWWDNDEDFFETFYGNDILGAVRAVCYGEYSYTDEYVRIDAYGNLETSNSIQSELEDNIDDIVEHIIENWEEFKDTIDITDDTKSLIDEYLKGE